LDTSNDLKQKFLTDKHAVHKSAEDYNLIHEYFKGSGGLTAIPNWNVQIFRIVRQNEEEDWNTKGWGKLTGINDNRRLLWHGTPIGNIQSILKNGLQDPDHLGGGGLLREQS
jgi:hypothetical protein